MSWFQNETVDLDALFVKTIGGSNDGLNDV